MIVQMLLAQLVPTAQPLPPAPALERYLLEQPLPVALMLVVLGLFVAVALNKRGQMMRGLGVGGGFLLAGAGVLGLAAGIETTRERLAIQTRQVIEATIEADQAAAGRLLANNLEVGTMDPDGYTLNRDRFLRVVAGFEMMGVRDWSASARGATIDGPNTGRVDYFVRVAGRGGLYTGPTPSVWRFTWRKGAGDEWRLTRLDCLSMYGKPVSADSLRWANKLVN